VFSLLSAGAKLVIGIEGLFFLLGSSYKPRAHKLEKSYEKWIKETRLDIRAGP
jgi:hypothetical protein